MGKVSSRPISGSVIHTIGVEFHQNKKREQIRDKKLTKSGYEVIHFPASYTINGIHKIKDTIQERFGLRMN